MLSSIAQLLYKKFCIKASIYGLIFNIAAVQSRKRGLLASSRNQNRKLDFLARLRLIARQTARERDKKRREKRGFVLQLLTVNASRALLYLAIACMVITFILCISIQSVINYGHTGA